MSSTSCWGPSERRKMRRTSGAKRTEKANAKKAGSVGAMSGTNIKGHMVKLNYSITDSLTFSITGYVTDLINNTVYNNVTEPNSTAIHMMADLMWKF